MSLGTTFQRIDSVRNFYQYIAAALPDMRVDVKAEYDMPGCSIREVVISRTHQGEYGGVKPTGNMLRVEMAAFCTFDVDSGKLISERIYYDQAGVLAQMQGDKSAAVA